MKVVCIINARGNSKGLPGKNIRMFGDKPLIAHTIESAINSKICDRVVVSTDDEEIAEISREYGAETPFMRPKDLANEFVHPEKSLVHAVEEIISSGYQFDITVMRDCTEPFIDEDDIINAVELLKKTNSCYGVQAVHKAHPNPYFGMVELNSHGYLESSKIPDKPITRRQDAPIVYARAGLFVYFTDKLLKERKMFTPHLIPYEIPQEHSYMIDNEIDFKIAEIFYNLKNN